MTDDTPLSVEEERDLDLVASFYDAVQVLDVITYDKFCEMPVEENADYAVAFAQAIIDQLVCNDGIKEQLTEPAEGFMLGVHKLLREMIAKNVSDATFKSVLNFNKHALATEMHKWAINAQIVSPKTIASFSAFQN